MPNILCSRKNLQTENSQEKLGSNLLRPLRNLCKRKRQQVAKTQLYFLHWKTKLTHLRKSLILIANSIPNRIIIRSNIPNFARKDTSILHQREEGIATGKTIPRGVGRNLGQEVELSSIEALKTITITTYNIWRLIGARTVHRLLDHWSEEHPIKTS